MIERNVSSILAGLLVPGGGQIVAGREARGLAVWLGILGVAMLAAISGASGHPRAFSALFAVAILFNVGAVVDAARSTRGPLRSVGATIALVAVALTASWGVQLVLRRQVVELFKVPSSSMEPSIQSGDHIVIDKRARTPSRGDVVVFRHDGLDYVKRVIAVGGDRIAFSAGAPILNGRAVIETPKTTHTVEGGLLRVVEEMLDGHVYGVLRSAEPAPDTAEIHLGPDELYLVGDNRDNSNDSRYFGPVKLADVKGTVRFVWFGSTRGRTNVELR